MYRANSGLPVCNPYFRKRGGRSRVADEDKYKMAAPVWRLSTHLHWLTRCGFSKLCWLFKISGIWIVLIGSDRLFGATCFLKADSHTACRSHAIPLPCRATKDLECVFPIWFTQCGRVWFTLAMTCPCHALNMPFFSRPQHSTAVERRPCCTLVLRRTAWSEHGMARVNQKMPHCVNQMGKTDSKP